MKYLIGAICMWMVLQLLGRVAPQLKDSPLINPSVQRPQAVAQAPTPVPATRTPEWMNTKSPLDRGAYGEKRKVSSRPVYTVN